MAQGVVDQFEIVQIDEQECIATTVSAPAALNDPLQLLHEVLPIVEAGQGVGDARYTQAFAVYRIFQTHRGHAGEDAGDTPNG